MFTGVTSRIEGDRQCQGWKSEMRQKSILKLLGRSFFSLYLVLVIYAPIHKKDFLSTFDKQPFFSLSIYGHLIELLRLYSIYDDALVWVEVLFETTKVTCSLLTHLSMGTIPIRLRRSRHCFKAFNGCEVMATEELLWKWTSPFSTACPLCTDSPKGAVLYIPCLIPILSVPVVNEFLL